GLLAPQAGLDGHGVGAGAGGAAAERQGAGGAALPVGRAELPARPRQHRGGRAEAGAGRAGRCWRAGERRVANGVRVARRLLPGWREGRWRPWPWRPRGPGGALTPQDLDRIRMRLADKPNAMW